MIDEIDALIGDTLLSVLRALPRGLSRPAAPIPADGDPGQRAVLLCRRQAAVLRDVRTTASNPPQRTRSLLAEARSTFARSRCGWTISQRTKCISSWRNTPRPPDRCLPRRRRTRSRELTQGQPWLVNALAYEACFRNKAGRESQPARSQPMRYATPVNSSSCAARHTWTNLPTNSRRSACGAWSNRC